MAVVSGASEDPRLDDPGYWKQRAEEARAMAAQLTQRESKRIMLGIAEGYEQMARAAERIQVSRGILAATDRQRQD